MMTVLYIFICAWARVFEYDIENKDLFCALCITDIIFAFVFAMIKARKMFIL